MYDTTVLMSTLMLLLLYAMRNEYICRTINISSRSVSLQILGDQNFKSELQRRIQSVSPNSLETESNNLD